MRLKDMLSARVQMQACLSLAISRPIEEVKDPNNYTIEGELSTLTDIGRDPQKIRKEFIQKRLSLSTVDDRK